MRGFKVLKVLSIIIILLTLVTTTAGLFWQDDGETFYVKSVYGENIKMFGKGLYSHESFFSAPVNKGTDAATLFVVVPLFLVAVLLNRRNSLKFRLIYLGLLSYLLYYSASQAFGVSYNNLFIVYILLFSTSLYSFILGICSIDTSVVKAKILPGLPHRAVAIFMFLAGLSVFVWLIEIIASITNGNPPASLGINTTEPTSVLDLGVIAPSAFMGGVLILKRKSFGYIVASILLTLNALIGLVVILQSIFQRLYGVNLSMQQFIAYVGVFVSMSLVATILNIKVLKNIKH